MDSVPWEDLAKLGMDTGAIDEGRGNIQRGFGYSTSRNIQMLTDELIKEHFGASRPNLRDGTDLPLIQDLFSVSTEIAREFGVGFAEPLFNDRKDFAQRRSLFSECLGSRPGNVFEGLTIAVSPYCSIPYAKVDKPLKPTKDHLDDCNCPLYQDVCVFAKFVPFRGKLCRVAVIAYQRKSVKEAFELRCAAEEMYNAMHGFEEEVESYRLPGTEPIEYFKAMVPKTVTFAIDTSNGKLVGASLDAPASADKFTTYVSQSAAAVMAFFEAKPDLCSWWRAHELVATIAYSNNILMWSLVLLTMASPDFDTDEIGHLGLFNAVLETANRRFGGIQGFRKARCSPWVNYDFKHQDLRKLVRQFELMSRQSHTDAPANKTDYKHVIQYQNKALALLSNKTAMTGTFGLTTLTQLAAALGLNSVTQMTRTATSALGTTHFSRPTGSGRAPKMAATKTYLAMHPLLERPDLCRRQQECALRRINVDKEENKKWAPDAGENTVCETNRKDKDKKHDPQLPGLLAWLVCDSRGSLTRHRPLIGADGEIIVEVGAAPTLLSTSRMVESEQRNTAPEGIIWGQQGDFTQDQSSYFHGSTPMKSIEVSRDEVPEVIGVTIKWDLLVEKGINQQTKLAFILEENKRDLSALEAFHHCLGKIEAIPHLWELVLDGVAYLPNTVKTEKKPALEKMMQEAEWFPKSKLKSTTLNKAARKVPPKIAKVTGSTIQSVTTEMDTSPVVGDKTNPKKRAGATPARARKIRKTERRKAHHSAAVGRVTGGRLRIKLSLAQAKEGGAKDDAALPRAQTAGTQYNFDGHCV